MKTFIKLSLLLFAVLASIFFTVLNPGTVQIDLYLIKPQLPLSALVVIALFFGLVLGALSNVLTVFGHKVENRKVCRKLEAAETELNNLRKMPLHGNS